MPLIGNTNVPSQYVSYVNAAAAATGLPAAVVAAQINDESGFNPNATSSAGAEGIAQFLPSTFKSYGTGSPYNTADAFAAYTKFMTALLQQFHGNIQDALAAYNAGPNNIPAGLGYAKTILSNAGVPASATAGKSSTIAAPSRNTANQAAATAAAGAVAGTSALAAGTTGPDTSGPGGAIAVAEAIPGIGTLVRALEPLFHAVATVIDYSFSIFEPGQGQRLMFALAALIVAFFAFRVIAGSGSLPRIPMGVT